VRINWRKFKPVRVGNMKRLVIILCLLAFGLGTQVSAIDRSKSKKEDLKSVEEKEGLKPKDETKSQEKAKSTDRKQTSPSKDYNDFIDRNNNGIDDRAERPKRSLKTDNQAEDKKDSTKKKSEGSSLPERRLKKK